MSFYSTIHDGSPVFHILPIIAQKLTGAFLLAKLGQGVLVSMKALLLLSTIPSRHVFKIQLVHQKKKQLAVLA